MPPATEWVDPSPHWNWIAYGPVVLPIAGVVGAVAILGASLLTVYCIIGLMVPSGVLRYWLLSYYPPSSRLGIDADGLVLDQGLVGTTRRIPWQYVTRISGQELQYQIAWYAGSFPLTAAQSRRLTEARRAVHAVSPPEVKPLSL